MTIAETELEMAKCHLRDIKARVARQQVIVDLLRAIGLSAQSAEMALSDFKALQHKHEACLSRLKSRHDDIAMPHPPFPWKRLP